MRYLNFTFLATFLASLIIFAIIYYQVIGVGLILGGISLVIYGIYRIIKGIQSIALKCIHFWNEKEEYDAD